MKYNVTRWMLTDSLNTRSFSWTSDSRLASLTAGLPTGNETYTYSPFGTRAKVGTRTFLRAGAGVTAGVLDDGNAKYTPGVSEVRSGTTTYSHSGLKHMGAQTDAEPTPAVQASRTYDAFGGVQASTGSRQGPFGTAGAFGYQSPQTGNEQGGPHLLGHRYYDASTGRFLTRDPIGDGSNWYAHCSNRPLRGVDPSGLEWHDPSRVLVDARFDGTVIVFGDFSWMKGDGTRGVRAGSGMITHPDMDVDLVLITKPDGSQEWYFLPGVGIPKDGVEERSVYFVDEHGRTHGPPPKLIFLPGLPPLPDPRSPIRVGDRYGCQHGLIGLRKQRARDFRRGTTQGKIPDSPVGGIRGH